MSNKLNPFEEQLKKAAENHSVPYDANQWNKLEKELGPSNSWATKVWAAVAVSVIVLGTAFYFSLNSKEEPSIENKISETTNKDVKETSVMVEEPENIQSAQEPKLVESLKLKKELSNTNSTVVIENEEELPEEESVEPQNNVVHQKVSESVKPEMVEQESIQSKGSDVAGLPEIVLNVTSQCAGVPVIAKLDDPEIENVEWHLSDGTVFTGKELNHVFLYGGVAQIKAYLLDEEVFVKSTEIEIKEKPNAIFSINEDFEFGMIPVHKFELDNKEGISYLWTLGDGTTFKGAEISHTYAKEGQYAISLTVYGKNGCASVNFNRVIVAKDFNLLAANGFTPNGDGLNDVWFPKALTSGYYSFNLTVMDKNSHVVFETKDANQSFDGKVNGKLPQPGDIFVWRAMTTDPDGVVQEFTGTFISMN